MPNLLEMKHCYKKFDGLQVLSDLSLNVQENQVVSVIGPSGGGKTTLLRCATLLEPLESGEIVYMGKYAARDVRGKSVYAPPDELKDIRNSFGLVFQNFNLFPHYSVLKNIMEAPMLVQKRNKAEAEETALELLRQMGIREKASAYPYQLSGGQQQRVAIARAMAMNPRILFFDEPTSALDPEMTGDVLRLLRGLAEKNMTMVIVTHEMSFAHDVSDRIVFMEGGEIVEEGTPGEVMDHPSQERTLRFLSKMLED